MLIIVGVGGVVASMAVSFIPESEWRGGGAEGTFRAGARAGNASGTR